MVKPKLGMVRPWSLLRKLQKVQKQNLDFFHGNEIISPRVASPVLKKRQIITKNNENCTNIRAYIYNRININLY